MNIRPRAGKSRDLNNPEHSPNSGPFRIGHPLSFDGSLGPAARSMPPPCGPERAASACRPLAPPVGRVVSRRLAAPAVPRRDGHREGTGMRPDHCRLEAAASRHSTSRACAPFCGAKEMADARLCHRCRDGAWSGRCMGGSGAARRLRSEAVAHGRAGMWSRAM